jgi:hypothetical protein
MRTHSLEYSYKNKNTLFYLDPFLLKLFPKITFEINLKVANKGKKKYNLLTILKGLIDTLCYFFALQNCLIFS